MRDLSEAELGWDRIDAIIEREDVVRMVVCPDPNHRAHVEFWLALLGWTVEAFVAEAYPEFDEAWGE